MKFPTIGRPDYDPWEVAKDGPFRAPRVWLHVQKVMTSCTVYAFALTIVLGTGITARSFHAAAVIAFAGPLLVSKVRELIAPTDPDTHTLGEMVLDDFTDGALYSVPFVLNRIVLGHWTAAVINLAVIVVVYRVCRNGARP